MQQYQELKLNPFKMSLHYMFQPILQHHVLWNLGEHLYRPCYCQLQQDAKIQDCDIKYCTVRYEILTPVTTRITVPWDTAPWHYQATRPEDSYLYCTVSPLPKEHISNIIYTVLQHYKNNGEYFLLSSYFYIEIYFYPQQQLQKQVSLHLKNGPPQEKNR